VGIFRLNPIRALRGLKGQTKPTVRIPSPVAGDFVLDLRDKTALEVHARIGRKPKDWKLAQRVAALMQQHPNGTIPELVAMDWLNQQQIEYIYLAQIYGGHRRKGGVEVDLLFQYAGVGIAWLVHGEYWHSRPEVSASDAIDRLRFLGATYHGIRIDKVVALWESDIYHRRPSVFELGLLGLGLRD
jgi:hypothetical protein